jgi:anaerobic selenocysteine-containing dehydrogenase
MDERRMTCPLCEAMCGLRVHLDGQRVGRVTANPDDVWSRGHVCPKGISIGALHDDPDRLRRPLVRRPSGEHVEVSWDDAFTEVEHVLRPVLESHGAGAMTVYIGNPVAHNHALASYVGALIGFAQAAGMGGYYTPSSVDQAPLNLVSALLFGGMWNSPVPDLANTDHLVVLGANPAASQGSMLSVPDVDGHLRAIAQRGTVVVVDPRRTPTAARASEWVPIRPGTDALLLFALLQCLDAAGAVRTPAHLAGRVTGLREVLDLARPFTPERVEAATGVPAATTRRLAADLAAARNPVLYSRIGACTQEFGTLATWLVFVLNTALGAVDRLGGAVFAKPAVWSPMFAKPPDQDQPGWTFGRYHSRVRKAPELFGQLPIGCLAEDIDGGADPAGDPDPDKGRIRALLTIAGNPAVSAPGAARLTRALPRLDAMISVDNWLNETTRHAHVVLPGHSPLEQAHADDLYWIYAAESCLKWNDPVLPPDPQRPAEWEILVRLAGSLLGTPVPEVDVAGTDDLYVAGMVATMAATPGNPLSGRDPDAVMAALPGHGPERLADLGIRLGPWGEAFGERPGGLTLDEVRRHPDGLHLAGPEGGRLEESVTTPSGTVELVRSMITDDVPRLLARLDRHDDGLVLVSRRHLRSNNSWLHNVPALTKGRDLCTLMIHPHDALAAGVGDGERARITTSEGEVVVPVEVTEEMSQGVVCLPHGWGHGQAGTRMAVANARPGVNNNLLAPTDLIDVPSGTHVVNGIPCTVVRA